MSSLPAISEPNFAQTDQHWPLYGMNGRRVLVAGIGRAAAATAVPAYDCARALYILGADIAATYRDRREMLAAVPLAQGIGAKMILPLDIVETADGEAVVELVRMEWGQIDAAVIALPDTRPGRFAAPRGDGDEDPALAGLVHLTRRIASVMPQGGTVTLIGGDTAPVARRRVESTARYLASELGGRGIRVHAVSPVESVAGGGPRYELLIDRGAQQSPDRAQIGDEELGFEVANLTADACLRRMMAA